MSETEAVHILSSLGGRARSAKQTRARRANGRLGGQKTSVQVQRAAELLDALKQKPDPSTLRSWLKVASRANVRMHWNDSFGKRPRWL